MLIQKEKTKYCEYVLSFDYNQNVVDFCRYLKSALGWAEFSYDPEKKGWRFKDPEVINMLKNKFPYIQVGAEVAKEVSVFKQKRKEEKEKEQNATRIKEAKVSNLEIKGIKGELYEYQKKTVKWLIDNQGRGLLSLDMGLGKTLCSLAYIVHSKKEKVLVICPSTMKYVWAEEIKKWSGLKPWVIHSKSDLTLEEYKKHDILIVNFDILKKFITFLTSVKLDSIIIDESTYIKNPQSLRAKAVKIISKNISSVILLSGSPLLNKVIELFTSLNILDPIIWNNYYSFALKYCGAHQTKYGLDVSGASNLPELRERVSKHIIRMKKEDVLEQLPEKKFIDIPVRLNDDIQKKYELLENSFITYLKEIKKKSNIEIQKALMGETLVKLNELRMLTTEGKIDFARELINNVLLTKEKIVVFSVFNKPLQLLHEEFKEESVIIIGSVADKDRQKAIQDFQNNPNKRIFFGGMRSANMGITLTQASVVLFVDFDWTPENMKQAYSRIDRIGQKADSISIYQIIALDTVDQKMSKILKIKQEIINRLIDGKEVDDSELNSGTIINDLIESYIT